MGNATFHRLRFLNDEGDVYIDVQRDGLRWSGDSRSPSWGGGYGIGRQTWDAFTRDGPLTETPPDVLAALTRILDALRAQGWGGRPAWDRASIDRALQDGAELRAWDQNGCSALHVCWDTDRMRRVIAAGVSIETLDADGRTPLAAAAYLGGRGDGLRKIARLRALGANLDQAQAIVGNAGRYILHATCESAWNTAAGCDTYESETFSADGFIRCATPLQLMDTLDHDFQGRTDVVVLVIARHRLPSDALVWMAIDDRALLFPSLYAPIPVPAVTGLARVPWTESGFDHEAITTESV